LGLEVKESIMEAVMQALNEVDNASNDLVQPLVDATGFKHDRLKFMLCIVFNVFFGFLVPYIRSANVKHAINIIVGLAQLTFQINTLSWVHSFFVSTLAYVLVGVLPRNRAPIVIFVFAFTYMSCGMIYKLYTDYGSWDMDWTTAQMICTLKVISFSFAYSDGARKESDFKSRYHKEHRLIKFPNPLQYYGFIYYFPTFISGPPIEIVHYLKWADRSLFANRELPNSFFPAMSMFMKSIAILVGVAILEPRFPLEFLYENAAKMNMLTRLIYTFTAMSASRLKYIMVFKLVEAGNIAARFSYRRDKNGVVYWDGMKNISLFQVEFGESLQQSTRVWNTKVSDFLKYHVYLRLMPADAKEAPLYVSLTTYFVSAIWHGFYPGYYYFFVVTAVADNIGRQLSKTFSPYFPQGTVLGGIYNLCGELLTKLHFAYHGICFPTLYFTVVLEYWRVCNYIGQIITAVMAVVFLFLVPMLRPKSKKKTQ